MAEKLDDDDLTMADAHDSHSRDPDAGRNDNTELCHYSGRVLGYRSLL